MIAKLEKGIIRLEVNENLLKWVPYNDETAGDREAACDPQSKKEKILLEKEESSSLEQTSFGTPKKGDMDVYTFNSSADPIEEDLCIDRTKSMNMNQNNCSPNIRHPSSSNLTNLFNVSHLSAMTDITEKVSPESLSPRNKSSDNDISCIGQEPKVLNEIIPCSPRRQGSGRKMRSSSSEMNVPKPRILFGPTMDKEEDLTINIRHSNQDELDDSKEDDTFELPPVLRMEDIQSETDSEDEKTMNQSIKPMKPTMAIIGASPPERTKSLRMTDNRRGDIILRRQEFEMQNSASEATSGGESPGGSSDNTQVKVNNVGKGATVSSSKSTSRASSTEPSIINSKQKLHVNKNKKSAKPLPNNQKAITDFFTKKTVKKSTTLLSEKKSDSIAETTPSLLEPSKSNISNRYRPSINSSNRPKRKSLPKANYKI